MGIILWLPIWISFIFFAFSPVNSYNAYVTILYPSSFPPMSHLRVQSGDRVVKIDNERSLW